ncbi:hypothetical protein ACFS5L_42725 [Streptomyces phyllanthi]|uniref:Uncharacterized protein n=1 Tax=Streptomyces phyllanthi TaxID=1803180 RepID=A0A5N8WE33_9ACTN|nr:hypothetical protein [Streptomyces phyllanthi]MPY45402.1 hypothetical protein [Streptomyces phyllanthi]
MQQPDHGQEPPPPPPPPPASPPPGFGPPPQPYAVPQPYAAPQPPAYAAPQPPAYAPYAYPAPGAPAGPEFLAVDRHNSIVVDASGVSFEDHGLSVEFPWPEIRSVHYRPNSNGKGLVVGVVHVDGHFYECVVDAKRRDRLHEWFTQLIPVLQYYRPMG